MPREARKEHTPSWRGAPVDVVVVVRHRVEADEIPPAGGRPVPQVGVEHLLPGGSVEGGGLSQHSVEVEQAGVHAVG
jgi:hypothetical protein